MSVAVITRLVAMGRWEPDARGRFGTRRSGAVRRARVRADDRRGDRRARRRHRAHLLPALRRQARGPLRRLRRAADSPGRRHRVRTRPGCRRSRSSAGRSRARRRCSRSAAGFAARRAAVIAATPALQERELLKLATMAAAATEALRARGVPDPAAGLAAQAGVAAFSHRVRALGRRRLAGRPRRDHRGGARRPPGGDGRAMTVEVLPARRALRRLLRGRRRQEAGRRRVLVHGVPGQPGAQRGARAVHARRVRHRTRTRRAARTWTARRRAGARSRPGARTGG